MKSSIADQEIEEIALDMFPVKPFGFKGQTSIDSNAGLRNAAIKAMKALRDKIEKG